MELIAGDQARLKNPIELYYALKDKVYLKNIERDTIVKVQLVHDRSQTVACSDGNFTFFAPLDELQKIIPLISLI